MKLIIKTISLTAFVIILSLTRSGAQKPHYSYEAGINLGTFFYQGDLIRSPFGSFKGVKPMTQLYVAKEFSPYLSYRIAVAFGSVSADESLFTNPSWKQLRNFSFSSPVTELSGVIVLNLYGENGKESYHTLTPYILAGAGVSQLNVQRDWSRIDTAAFSKSQTLSGLGIDTLHATPRILPVIPVGAGLRWSVSPSIAVNAEVVMRLSFSDYIDGFSYAAHSKAMDSYYGISLGVGVRLGDNGVKCPPVKR